MTSVCWHRIHVGRECCQRRKPGLQFGVVDRIGPHVLRFGCLHYEQLVLLAHGNLCMSGANYAKLTEPCRLEAKLGWRLGFLLLARQVLGLVLHRQRLDRVLECRRVEIAHLYRWRVRYVDRIGFDRHVHSPLRFEYCTAGRYGYVQVLLIEQAVFVCVKVKARTHLLGTLGKIFLRDEPLRRKWTILVFGLLICGVVPIVRQLIQLDHLQLGTRWKLLVNIEGHLYVVRATIHRLERLRELWGLACGSFRRLLDYADVLSFRSNGRRSWQGRGVRCRGCGCGCGLAVRTVCALCSSARRLCTLRIGTRRLCTRRLNDTRANQNRVRRSRRAGIHLANASRRVDDHGVGPLPVTIVHGHGSRSIGLTRELANCLEGIEAVVIPGKRRVVRSRLLGARCEGRICLETCVGHGDAIAVAIAHHRHLVFVFLLIVDDVEIRDSGVLSRAVRDAASVSGERSHRGVVAGADHQTGRVAVAYAARSGFAQEPAGSRTIHRGRRIRVVNGKRAPRVANETTGLGLRLHVDPSDRFLRAITEVHAVLGVTAGVASGDRHVVRGTSQQSARAATRRAHVHRRRVVGEGKRICGTRRTRHRADQATRRTRGDDLFGSVIGLAVVGEHVGDRRARDATRERTCGPV